MQLAYYSDSVFESVLMLAERERAIAGTKLRKFCDEMARTLGIMKGIIEDDQHRKNGEKPPRTGRDLRIKNAEIAAHSAFRRRL